MSWCRMRKQMMAAASVVQASTITPSRSYRTRNLRSPLSHAIVRSTTQRILPSPLPCGVRRLPTCGSIPSHLSSPRVAPLSYPRSA